MYQKHKKSILWQINKAKIYIYKSTMLSVAICNYTNEKYNWDDPLTLTGNKWDITDTKPLSTHQSGCKCIWIYVQMKFQNAP